MGLMAPKIRLNEAVGNEIRICRRHSDSPQNRRGELAQVSWTDQHNTSRWLCLPARRGSYDGNEVHPLIPAGDESFRLVMDV